MSTHLRDESGMTIIELIVSISVLGIIIGPVTIMMMLGLISGNATRERISDSAAAQLTSAYFVTDVDSSDTVEVPTTSPATTPKCSTDSGTVKVRLMWADAEATTNATLKTLVEYIDRATGDNGLHDLWRYECDQSATPIVRTKQRLVRSVDFAGLASDGIAAVTCNTAPVTCPAGTARSVSDGSVVSGTTTITSSAASFTSGDVGMSVFGSGIPNGATITGITSSSTAVISSAATATRSNINLLFGGPASVRFKIRANANSGSSAQANTNVYKTYTFTLQGKRRETPQ